MSEAPTETPPSTEYAGIYRGVVEDVNDPQKRGRVRVRVTYVHPSAVETSHLPWAEIAAYGGRGFGDTPHYENGDLVWCMFEGGDRLFPVVLGGWLSKRRGIHDLPAEEVENYDNNRRRWIRHDRAGNVMEMSDADGKPFMRMRSGDAEVRISKSDSTVTVESEGAVRVVTPKALVRTDQTFLESDDIVANANGRDEVGRPNGQLNIYSNFETRVYAADTVRIGQYIDERDNPRQTKQLLEQPESAVLGRMSPSDGTKRTLSVTIEGSEFVNIASEGKVEATAPNITARARSKAYVYSGSSVEIVTPQFNVSGASNKLGRDVSSFLSAELNADIAQSTGSGLSPKDIGSLESPGASGLSREGNVIDKTAGEVIDAIAGTEVPSGQAKSVFETTLNTDLSSILGEADIRDVSVRKLIEGLGV